MRTSVIMLAALALLGAVLGVVVATTGSAAEERPLEAITVHAPQRSAPTPDQVQEVPAAPGVAGAPGRPAPPMRPVRPPDASTLIPPPPPPVIADVPAPPPAISPGDDDWDDDDWDDDDDDDGDDD